jgi:arginine decarboxylase
MEHEHPTAAGVSLTDLFDYSSHRLDHWRSLQRMSTTAVRHPDPHDAERMLHEIRWMSPAEGFWGFPGPEILGELEQRLLGDDVRTFNVAVRNITTALHSKSYRRDPRARNVMTAGHLEDALPTARWDLQVAPRPYFELLVVGTEDPENHARMAQWIRGLRQPTDDFVYEVVLVESLQDALVALALNPEIQAVVAHDGFPFHSELSLPNLEAYLQMRQVKNTGDLGVALLNLAAEFRPEVDRYLLVDRTWEAVAGTQEASNVRRIFYGIEEMVELHLSVLEGVRERYQTPFFDNLKRYAQRPMGTYHALPIARGKSIFKSNWIRDMGEFYGENLFLAESSATTGGLDSLLDPKGNIKKAQQLAARAFGADHAFYATNGTSTSNKIVGQALCTPGDIVLIDRDCHKSHHYACVLTGAQPYYIDAFRLTDYSMYGGVPIRRIKEALLHLKASGDLDRVKMLILTNATFDGHMAHTLRTMRECLAIKPDLVFLWDEAWSASARFSPYLRQRTAMGGAHGLRQMQHSLEYRERYAKWSEQGIALDGSDPRALETELLPDPDLMKVRVYQTTSIHKSMSALRQASIILVADQLFGDVEEQFREAFFTHTSTSPNQQIIASLDIARRQMELEGYELVSWALQLSIELRQQINTSPLISKYFRALTPAEMIPADLRSRDIGATRSGVPTWYEALRAIDTDEFFLDPTRVTVMCGRAGMDGSEFKQLLAEDYEIQINKTSRNSVLFQININNTRGDVAHLVKVLADIARRVDERLRSAGTAEREAFEARVASLVDNPPKLPDFSAFHDAFRDNPVDPTRHGHMREAYFLAYDAASCDHLLLDSPELAERLENGPALVGANFIIPYPPGFPLIVPGQIITRDIVDFMNALDVSEIHGYDPLQGLKLIKAEVLEDLTRTRRPEQG